LSAARLAIANPSPSRGLAMNRHERRRQAAMAGHNSFVAEYVHHLPEVGLEALGRPGVSRLGSAGEMQQRDKATIAKAW
jgi:hypothetical protein